MASIRYFFQLSRPIFLAGVAVLYALGAGIAHYLGATISWEAYILGQVWVRGLPAHT